MIFPILNFILHVDTYLEAFIAQFGFLTHFILFGIIFCETGLVVMPFLPGDSLLFAAGALSAKGLLNPALLFVLLSCASILGDSLNYWVGYFFGDALIQRNIIKPSHMNKTHAFFEKYGPKVVVFARFIPIVRTCAPFVSGVGKMPYRRFLAFSISGSFLWVGIGVFSGFLFGNIPFIKTHFSAVILGIVLVSFLPVILGVINDRLKTRFFYRDYKK